MHGSRISGHLGRPLHKGFREKLDCCFCDQTQNIHSARPQFYSFQAQLEVPFKQIMVHGRKKTGSPASRVRSNSAVSVSAWKRELERYLLQMFSSLLTSVWCDSRLSCTQRESDISIYHLRCKQYVSTNQHWVSVLQYVSTAGGLYGKS